jgi:hypothetical protein
VTDQNKSSENMGPKNGTFDEASSRQDKVDPKVGVGGIKTPAGQRSGPGGATGDAANDPGLTTGSDMGTEDDIGA